VAITMTPTTVPVTCPRCKTLREFVNVAGSAIQYRCGGCEWYFTFGTQAPTGVSNAILAQAGTAISVASGGASFTNGMVLLFDTANVGLTEILVVSGSASGVSIPVTLPGYWPTSVGVLRQHATAAAFGQLLLTPSYNAAGEDAVPPAPGWGF
jgi:hypothetical protein